ncbi:UDP-N-acetylmuramate dehydrogenase [Blattabacterium cuenoti]|uniref:UDP-N-acetylmuramate dehydrogenase n=1 Tax=Blattabacterium cuenoti TaxID=1653831 RepID=UPI00163CF442|nr:UDP-N-acetylmuramate dehydrogenase [Blattabacterium cuenoti]
MLIKKNFSLKKFNTFGINVYARYFVIIKQIHNLIEIFNKYINIPKLILGNGSNILFLKNYYPGLIIKIEIEGIEIIHETKNKVILKVFSGENWSKFVKWTINNGFYGLENLSFIPGTVGVSPIQNIGSYGTEIKDFILKVQVYDIIKKKILELTQKECKFSYRNSIFKKNLNKYLIISVFFILKKNYRKLNINYIDIKKKINFLNLKYPTINDLIKIIESIRKKKIPDPKKIGNAGSFFTNPIVEKNFFRKLKLNYPNIVGHPINNNKIKISTNCLIEYVGWKGRKIGDVEVYEKYPIILLNHGNASGMEIYSISEQIIQDVKKKLGVFLSREVDIIID